MGGTDGSPGSTTGRHHRDEERSWLEMLAADDDVEGPSLLRAPDVLTRNGASPDAPVLDDDGLLLRPLGSLGDDDNDFACGGDVCDLVHRAPVHGGIARGVISALRRSATDVGGELGRRRADVRAAASPRGVAPRGEARRRPPDRGGGGHARGRHSPLAGGPGDASLVERLRDSVRPEDVPEDLSGRRGARGGLRRARTLPTNLHAHDDDLALDPRAARAHVVAARAAEAAAQAASPRPFGYLGVTRPPWTTRWEANLVDEHTGGHVFLGNFDQKESAARAHDAAKLKLALGDDEPVPPDQLNFDASDYHEELSAMTECTFEDFVKTLVTHSYGGGRSAGHSKFRGVFAREDGLWEAKLDAEDAGGGREDRRWKK